MADIVLARELTHYAVVWVGLAATFIRIGVGALRPAQRRVRQPLPASSAAWFTPVYLWGITSVLHSQWWLTAGFKGIAPHPYFFARHAMFSLVTGLIVVTACLLAEHWGRRVGLPVRSSGGSLPLPVCAAVVAVASNWWLKLSLVFYPRPF